MSAALSNPVGALVGFEVATSSADTLRAHVTVVGAVGPGNASLLISVLNSHLKAGRRYLRVDLAQARILDPLVVADLVRAHASTSELGGMLVFENADAQVRELAGDDTLFVRGPV